MEFVFKNPKIIMISGKSGSGKNTVTNIIKEFYGNSAIELSFSYYLKEYAKKISNWDGNEETKPRDLLQQLGIELIKNNINSMLFINRMLEDIKVFSYFYKVIIISDARLIDEIESIKNNCSNVFSIRLNRNVDNGLNDKQKQHLTEIELDNYNDFDYVINNNETIKELKEKVIEILNEV